MARPSKYTDKLGREICKLIAQGYTLRQIGRMEKMPSKTTVFNWLFDARYKEFLDQYETAKKFQTEDMADELMEIADNGENDWVLREGKDGEEYWVANGEHIQRSRLRTDVRKWLMSKMMPKKYGDKIQQEHTGPDGEALQPVQIVFAPVGSNGTDKD